MFSPSRTDCNEPSSTRLLRSNSALSFEIDHNRMDGCSMIFCTNDVMFRTTRVSRNCDNKMYHCTITISAFSTKNHRHFAKSLMIRCLSGKQPSGTPAFPLFIKLIRLLRSFQLCISLVRNLFNPLIFFRYLIWER